MKIFVAGGTGVLGLRVVRSLARAGHVVSAPARSEEEILRLRTAGAHALAVDLFDSAAVTESVAGSDAVLRLTAEIPPLPGVRWDREWEAAGQLSIAPGQLLADACVSDHVACYVHESTSFLYADGEDDWLAEGAAVAAAGVPHLEDALEGEHLAARVTSAGGRGIVLRFAALYGADSPRSLDLALSMRHRRFALVGPGTGYFASIHLDDAASATVAALAAPAGVYNVGDNSPIPLRENLAALARAIDAPPMRRLPRFLGPAVMGQAWQYLQRSQRVSARRFRETTGWSPEVADARIGWPRVVAEWVAAGRLR